MLDSTQISGTTADVISVIRLTPMHAGTRVHTINAVRALREHLSGGPEMSAEAFFQLIDAPSADLRSRLGARHAQIISDVRRAKRAWSDPVRRDLVLRMRGQFVRRQGFWNQRRLKLIESSAHLVDCIMRRAGGDASVALRVSFV